MPSSGGRKFETLVDVSPGETRNRVWNNANAEVYSLQAWPVVPTGVTASAEITQMKFVVHGDPPERELRYSVKNTGSTSANIDVWAYYWNA